MSKDKSAAQGWHDDWADAGRRWGLTPEDVRMAEELGVTPMDILAQVASPWELWQKAVQERLRQLREGKPGEEAQAHRRRGRGDKEGDKVPYQFSMPAPEAYEEPSSAKTPDEEDDEIVPETEWQEWLLKNPFDDEPPTRREKPKPETQRPQETRPAPAAPQDARQTEGARREGHGRHERRPSPQARPEQAAQGHPPEAPRREEQRRDEGGPGQGFARKRQEQFRRAGEGVAKALSRVAEVEKVVLFGSVAAPLRKEMVHTRHRGKVEGWHECRDVDLAVWVRNLDCMKAVQRVRSEALNTLYKSANIGVAHHQIDIFIMEMGTDRYLGRLCCFGACPKGKLECRVQGCGRKPFLRQHEGFQFRPESLTQDPTITLFERSAAAAPVAAPVAPVEEARPGSEPVEAFEGQKLEAAPDTLAHAAESAPESAVEEAAAETMAAASEAEPQPEPTPVEAEDVEGPPAEPVDAETEMSEAETQAMPVESNEPSAAVEEEQPASEPERAAPRGRRRSPPKAPARRRSPGGARPQARGAKSAKPAPRHKGQRRAAREE